MRVIGHVLIAAFGVLLGVSMYFVERDQHCTVCHRPFAIFEDSRCRRHRVRRARA